ncbi:uncharacterized protein METZ01_LOCUS452887, partial [marine metagenome]
GRHPISAQLDMPGQTAAHEQRYGQTNISTELSNLLDITKLSSIISIRKITKNLVSCF